MWVGFWAFVGVGGDEMKALWFVDDDGLHFVSQKNGKEVARVEPEQVLHLATACLNLLRDQQVNRNRENFIRSKRANND